MDMISSMDGSSRISVGMLRGVSVMRDIINGSTRGVRTWSMMVSGASVLKFGWVVVAAHRGVPDRGPEARGECV